MSSDEASSAVTYTSIFSDYEEPSDAGSPGVFVYGYDGLPMLLVDLYVEVTLQALPFLDCVSLPKEPEQAPPLPEYIPGPEYPEDGGDDDDDSSRDDVDDKDEEEASKEDEDEEEEEHLAPADSTVVSPDVDHD
nr:hypothetical protein [Tanacetum cinerariifolium]